MGYGDLCRALVPERPYRDPAGLRGGTAVALGRRIPAAGPLWSPELGLRHGQNPGWEKQTCIHPSRGCSSSLRFSSREGSGAAPPCTAFFPFLPSAEPGPWRLVPARPHLCTPYGHLAPSAAALPPAPRSSPRCWDAPSPPRGSPSCAPSPAPCSLRADTGTQHLSGRPAAGAVMQSGSMEALTPREGKHGQDHGDHSPGYRAAGSSGAPPGAPGTNNSKKPGSGRSPLHEALRSTGGWRNPGAPGVEEPGHRGGTGGAPAGGYRAPAAPRCLPRPPHRAQPQRAARN